MRGAGCSIDELRRNAAALPALAHGLMTALIYLDALAGEIGTNLEPAAVLKSQRLVYGKSAKKTISDEMYERAGWVRHP
jgi:hypothetical protein